MDRKKALTSFLVVGIIVLSGLLAWQYFIRRPRLQREGSAGQVAQVAPNTTYTFPHPTRPHWIPNMIEHKESIRSWMDFSFTTNNKGFRGRDLGPAKPEGVFRIVVVGECVAFGFGVAEDEPYPVLVENDINEAAGHHVVEVLNVSLFGAAPQIIAGLFHSHVNDLSPDLIIFAPGTDTVFVPEHVMSPARLDLGEQQYAAKLRAYHDILAQATHFARQHRAPIVFVTPTMNSFFLPDGMRWLKLMKDYAAQQNIPVLDTTAVVSEVEHSRGLVLETKDGVQRLVRYEDGDPEGLFEVPFVMGTDGRHVAAEIYGWLDDNPTVRPVMNIDDNHLTAEGHRIVADALLTLLRDNQLLPE